MRYGTHIRVPDELADKLRELANLYRSRLGRPVPVYTLLEEAVDDFYAEDLAELEEAA